MSEPAMIACSCVAPNLERYLGLERKVIWPASASSIPATPLISRSGAPSNLHFNRTATSPSFMIVPRDVWPRSKDFIHIVGFHVCFRTQKQAYHRSIDPVAGESDSGASRIQHSE